VLKEDEEIDILEKQVDQDGVNLLIRFHPVASDMREVVSAMKVSSNLERIADESVSIARRAKHLNNKPAVRELALLEPPYRLALTIFRDSMRAFADGDYELAGTLKLKDRELDALTNDVNEKLVERATQDSELVPNYVDLIFVARALVRQDAFGNVTACADDRNRSSRFIGPVGVRRRTSHYRIEPPAKFLGLSPV
jgi:phosphate transport system protein